MQWRQADAKRCARCGLYWGLHQFAEPVEGEKPDEYAGWCNSCVEREVAELRRQLAALERHAAQEDAT